MELIARVANALIKGNRQHRKLLLVVLERAIYDTKDFDVALDNTYNILPYSCYSLITYTPFFCTAFVACAFANIIAFSMSLVLTNS